MKIVFSGSAWQQYQHWVANDRATLKRLNALIEECRRTPFAGTGKPEPLRGELRGWWSRRINDEDRLVYRVTGAAPDQAIEIAACRYHYK